MAEFLPGRRYNRFYLPFRSRESELEELMLAKAALVEHGFSYVVLKQTDEEPALELRRLLDAVCGYPIEADQQAGLSLYTLE